MMSRIFYWEYLGIKVFALLQSARELLCLSTRPVSAKFMIVQVYFGFVIFSRHVDETGLSQFIRADLKAVNHYR